MAADTTRTRKLAVIVHADVAGSTALVQREEILAHQRITAAFARFSEVIASYDGTVLEIRGDALVAEFARASDAVSAALCFQHANTEHNSELSDGLAPIVRVGISLGEVVIADNTVTGPAIVLAQRVEQLAVPGCVCVTGAVQEAVPSRLPFTYEDLGERTVKGFDELVRVYAVELKQGEDFPAPEAPVLAGANTKRVHVAWGALVVLVAMTISVVWIEPWQTALEPAESETDPLTLPDKPSIAVLPFVNMSEDESQEYFSDGLTEDLITALARLSGLLVIARNSSFAYKEQSLGVREVGRRLGVRYLLKGSVRRSGDRLRVSAQLIDAGSASHIWADRFDRELDDIFALQDELTRTIVDALAVELPGSEAASLARPEDVGFDAYDVLLRGNGFYQRYTPEDNAAARGYYLKAIALNPRYARAHANLAMTYGLEASTGWAENPSETVRMGLKAAEDARRLDPRLPQLYFALSLLYRADRRLDKSVSAARHALHLDPNYADGAAVLAAALIVAGELDQAMSALKLARRANPHYPYQMLQIEGRALYLQGEYEKAVQRLEEALKRNPSYDLTHIILAATYAKLGRLDDAEWAAEEVLALRPAFSIDEFLRVRGYQGDLRQQLADGLHKAGLPR